MAWENAQDPQPSDIVAVKADYALQPGDLVRISIFELYQEGVALVNDYIVSETGKISVPDVGVIQAAGLTERQLEDQIKQILSPGVLRNPSVTVTLLDSQQRTFSILGNAVARPSRYVIPRYEYHLTDALATAGAQMQFNVSNIYVSRRGEADRRTRRRRDGRDQKADARAGLDRARKRTEDPGHRAEDARQGTTDRGRRTGGIVIRLRPESRSLPSRPRRASRSGRCSI